MLLDYASHGDLKEFIQAKPKISNDEKLVRTLFSQLIEGLKYLHSQGVYHLDIKLSNLLIDGDYRLKIADFDQAYISGDKEILSKGSYNYRAPELIKGEEISNFAALDIYSAGVVLFTLKCRGQVPHNEGEGIKGFNLMKYLNLNSHEFWKSHCLLQGQKASYFSSDFKDLFEGMTKEDPYERWTFHDIEKSAWLK
mmetsp:Transcript_32411/g.29217  ORF Transcript_32411/g.29217 Transcript_32411/m.29217 type:complete len:196 (-) Transcript_32411:298-885(-)